MFQVAKNLKDNIFQFTNSFAGEIDATKTYKTIVDLENTIANKLFIFPGKIVYVLETKTFYYIDLIINEDAVYSEEIKTEWLNHLESIKNKKDFTTADYELSGYTNDWTYEPLVNPITIPNNSGYTPITENGEVVWQQSKIIHAGDISHEFDTTIATFDFVVNGFKIYLSVNGEKDGILSLYSSNINILKEDDLNYNEFGVLNKNDLDIDFKCFYNSSADRWEMTLKKNDSNCTITKAVLNIQII